MGPGLLKVPYYFGDLTIRSPNIENYQYEHSSYYRADRASRLVGQWEPSVVKSSFFSRRMSYTVDLR